MTIGDRLKYFREQKGFSQAEMATKLGLKNQQSYSYYEKLGDKFELTKAQEFSKTLGFDLLTDKDVTKNYLLKDDGVEYRKATIAIEVITASILKQQALLELLFEDKIEEVAKQTKRSVSVVSSEYQAALNLKLRALEREFLTAEKS